MTDYYSLLEDAPAYCRGVADLFSWSSNYDSGKGSAALFLDLIGWSMGEMGETMYDLSASQGSLGYLELGKVASALSEYADRPGDVRDYVDSLLAAEMES